MKSGGRETSSSKTWLGSENGQDRHFDAMLVFHQSMCCSRTTCHFFPDVPLEAVLGVVYTSTAFRPMSRGPSCLEWQRASPSHLVPAL